MDYELASQSYESYLDDKNSKELRDQQRLQRELVIAKNELAQLRSKPSRKIYLKRGQLFFLTSNAHALAEVTSP